MDAPLTPKPASASNTQLADLILPTHANTMGTVFGGKILEMVDKAAGVCAMRHSGKPCVTVAMDRVEFLVPIKVGDLLVVEARLLRAGRTSMEIGVEVFAEDLKRSERRPTNSCKVTMVAVDDQGRPSPVPPLG
ncbi:MAG: acyl-CoA thioesterase [Elusimicrobia bacterium]|nr:acyl-CoA thioesterase [Elusimicrobiota bacterium]